MSLSSRRRAVPSVLLAGALMLVLPAAWPGPVLAQESQPDSRTEVQQDGNAAVVPSIGPERMEAAVAYPIAQLQGLDKVTARISTFRAPVDQPVTFGSLTIRVRACWKNPPELTPESAAYLEISDSTQSGDKAIFSGWMYASSPAVNGLEHPVYDVWVLDCLPAGNAAGQDAAGQDAAGQDAAGQDAGGGAAGGGDRGIPQGGAAPKG
ncbi:hypothetical protein SAMN06265365_124100 [Tistlia consotensis]|uniref:DUF2155 domain-containing protein n=1 Tax=Tistlia consotensis USBA 355 TaxID=560819 RepID=A0A1Y6CPC2_9PROT|nr:DUF2155 domain-containing protein [Tistlia consotensis]SMF67025.1 hypothetical protein SAMN05428998_1275 [Tistlia consotensis USBA 355]SNS00555.1 hypothetical protein SAMN06265365_124100 [Tistlia consotensis]